MATHKLKVLPERFEAISNGIKEFEILDNSEIDFQTGDLLIFWEFNPSIWCDSTDEYGIPTGKQVLTQIKYISNFNQPKNQIIAGFFILDGKNND